MHPARDVTQHTSLVCMGSLDRHTALTSETSDAMHWIAHSGGGRRLCTSCSFYLPRCTSQHYCSRLHAGYGNELRAEAASLPEPPGRCSGTAGWHESRTRC